MKHILAATLALAMLSISGVASAQYDRDRDDRNDRYSRDRDYDRNNDRYDRRDSARDWERQRNQIWRELFARQEDERREFYRCTPYRKGSREYNRALDRIVDRQERERCDMRERLSREGRNRY